MLKDGINMMLPVQTSDSITVIMIVKMKAVCDEYEEQIPSQLRGADTFMQANKNLTRELAVKLLRSQEVVCPGCRTAVLKSRWAYKNQITEYKCPSCATIYRPCALI